jgi:GAF domain-containing protein
MADRKASPDVIANQPLEGILEQLDRAEEADALLYDVLDAAIDIAGASMGNIQLLDHDAGGLKIAASRGFSAPFLEFFASVTPTKNCACGAVLNHRMRITVDDVAVSYLFVGTPALDVMMAANARAVHSTPLLSSSGRLIGVISTHWQRPLHDMPYDPAPFDLLATHLADRLEQLRSRSIIKRGGRP